MPIYEVPSRLETAKVKQQPVSKKAKAEKKKEKEQKNQIEQEVTK